MIARQHNARGSTLRSYKEIQINAEPRGYLGLLGTKRGRMEEDRDGRRKGRHG